MRQGRLNVAVVGCGKIAEKHLAALRSLPEEARLVAVCDRLEERAREKAREYAVPYYLDYREMVENHPEIDLVHILVPTGLHAPVVIELARRGRNILVEKPMALRVEEAEEMVRVCREAGVKLFVMYQNRYNRPVRAARKALEAERFGKMVLGTVRVRWCRRRSYYETAAWRGTWAFDGGVMAQQASHHLDLLQYFLGPVETVQCQIATRLLDIEVEDTAAAILKFRSGALGILEATVAARPSNLEGSLSLLGERGSVVIGGFAVNELTTWRFSDEEENAVPVSSSVVPSSNRLYMHIEYFRDVIRAVRDKVRISSICDAEEGLANVRILSSLYESAARGGEPLPPGAPVIRSRLGVREKRPRTPASVGD